MKKIILIIICICLFITKNSYTLTDKEYNLFLANSSEFKKYDNKLNNIWKVLMSEIPSYLKNDLLNDQRYYVAKGRDVDLDNVYYRDSNKNAKTISKLDKCILSTRKRIQELEYYLKYVENNEVVIEGEILSLHDEAGGGFGICNNIYKDDKFITACYHIGYYFELKNNKELYDFLENVSNSSGKKQIVKIKGKMDSPSSFEADSVSVVTSSIPETLYSDIIDSCDIEKLDYLINKGYNMNAPLEKKDSDDFKEYPLTYAVSKNAVPVVKYLIKRGVDLDVENDIPIAGSERAVTLASDKYNVTMLKLLIDAGARLSWPNADMDNRMFDGCLCNIIDNSDNEILKYALEHGAMPNSSSCSGDCCRHPLAEAVHKNNIEAIRILLKNGADVNYQDPYGSSPLIIAIKNDNSVILNLLLQYGADVNKEGNDGTNLEMKTPLDYANEKNNKEILAILSKYAK